MNLKTIFYKKNILLTTFILMWISKTYAQDSSGLISLINDTLHYKTEVVSIEKINSKALDFSPTFFRNGLLFLSNRQKDNLYDTKVKDYAADLYFAKFNKNGFEKPSKLSPLINSRMWEGPAAFDSIRNKLYFSRNNQDEFGKVSDEKNNTWVHLYEATLIDGKWTNIKPMSFNENDISTMHPALNEQGDLMVFSRSDSSGSNNMDLFFSTFSSGFWSAPRSLGPSLNSPFSEGFPFLKGDTLFFASNRSESMGGFDIYYSVIVPGRGKWEYATPLPAPFNTFEDDFGLIVNKDGTSGYLSSRREKEEKDNIFRFSIQQVKPFLSEIPIYTLDAKSKKAITNVELWALKLNEDGTLSDKSAIDTQLNSINDNGFILSYIKKAEVKLENALTKTDEFGKATLMLPAGSKFLLVALTDGYDIAYQNILTTNSTGTYFIPLQKSANCKTILGTIHSKSNNQPLANSPIRFVHGDTKTDTTVYTNKEGQYQICLSPGHKYRLRASGQGYLDFVSEFTPDDQPGELIIPKISLESFNGTIDATKVDSGAVLTLQNIYYDYNSAAIRKDAASELEDLAFIMQNYPKMIIELGAHTDSRGPEWANNKLSRERAESAKQYLIQKGIDNSRISTIGYGESKLVNACGNDVPCSEKEHQQNRRTEVKIINLGNSAPQAE